MGQRLQRCRRLLPVLLGALLIAKTASASPPRAAFALEVEISPGATCQGKDAIVQRLGARLGYLPESGPNAVIARVTVTLSDHQLVGRVQLARGDAPPRSTVIEVGAESCDALFDAIALTLALAIDPLGSGAAKEAVTSTEAAPPEAPPPLPAATFEGAAVAPFRQRPDALSAVGAAPEPGELRLLAGVVAPLGSLPAAPPVAFGVIFGFAFQHEALEVHAEAEYVPEERRDLAGGSVEVSSLSGRVAGCFRRFTLGFCGALTAGGVFVSGVNLASVDRSGAAAALGFGPRLWWSPNLDRRMGLRLVAGLELMAVRAELLLGRDVVWTMPVMRGELGLSVWVLLW